MRRVKGAAHHHRTAASSSPSFFGLPKTTKEEKHLVHQKASATLPSVHQNQPTTGLSLINPVGLTAPRKANSVFGSSTSLLDKFLLYPQNHQEESFYPSVAYALTQLTHSPVSAAQLKTRMLGYLHIHEKQLRLEIHKSNQNKLTYESMTLASYQHWVDTIRNNHLLRYIYNLEIDTLSTLISRSIVLINETQQMQLHTPDKETHDTPIFIFHNNFVEYTPMTIKPNHHAEIIQQVENLIETSGCFNPISLRT